MQKFSGLIVLAILVVVESKAYSFRPFGDHYLHNDDYDDDYDERGFGSGGSYRYPILIRRYGRTASAQDVVQPNQFLPGYSAYPDHGLIGGIHIVALTAPKPFLAGADGSNVFNQVSAHILHNEPHAVK